MRFIINLLSLYPLRNILMLKLRKKSSS